MAAQDPERELFDFQRAKLGSLEGLDRMVNTLVGQGKQVAFVCVRVGGIVGMNQAAREMLGRRKPLDV